MEPKPTQAREFRFRCPLAAGLHARPASRLAEVANEFRCETTLRNLRNYALANLKSVLSIIAAEVRHEDECALHVRGDDEDAAFATLQRFIETELPRCDEPLVQPVAASRSLPRALRDAGVRAIFGTPASPGLGRGRIVRLGGLTIPALVRSEAPQSKETEQARVDNAIAAVRVALEGRLARRANAVEQGVLKAHLALTSDPSLAGRISNLIDHGRGAGQAIVEACETFSAMMRSSESAYIRERALDMQDVCSQLLQQIYGEGAASERLRLVEPSIVVAANCTPQQLLSLDRENLRGLALETAGATSHTLILARSLGIAALTAVPPDSCSLHAGADAIIDGFRGFLVPEISPAAERYYEFETQVISRRDARLARFASGPAATSDGQRLEIGANVAAVEELEPAFQNGADGIGVFRTEMLFAGRDDLPTEAEQFEAYAAAARAAAGKPVILRTLDVGGDKPLACLDLPQEENPFLGERGVRLYRRHEAVIRTQVRAILRASAHGRVMLMVPMIASLDEVRWCKTLVESVKQELAAEKVTFDDKMPFGIMIEVPSVAFLMPELAREVDFFSIGTNDLAQYFFAAGRDNRAVAAIADPLSPAFLRLLKHIVDAARHAGKWIGICGQMAAEPRHLPIVLGLGVDEIGVPATNIPGLKERASRMSSATCREVLQRATSCLTSAEVGALLDSAADQSLPLVADELIVWSAVAQSKDEVLRELAGTLWAAGRIEDRARIEDALWTREEVYSTGLGHGFAVPHCKSAAVHSASIAVLRLAQPIEWGSLDHQPVRMAILLALPENAAKQHLQVFARLARKLMNEEFRNEILGAADAAAVRSCMERNVIAEA
jgi:multiphosphoryl transfer protein